MPALDAAEEDIAGGTKPIRLIEMALFGRALTENAAAQNVRMRCFWPHSKPLG